MLVIRRKLHEAVVIGGNIRVSVTKIERGQVQLGINAPEEVNIVREEKTSMGGSVAAPYGQSTIGDGSEGV
ncbi:MAG: carbon storage regulator [Geminicoccaceae bacterium]